VTMDGIHYSECEATFKIYSNDIYLTSINPKCGGIQGGTTLTLLVNIDEVTAQTIQSLKIGFQPKKSLSVEGSKNSIEGGQASHRLDGQKSYQSLHESHKSSVRGSRSILQAYPNNGVPEHQQIYEDLTAEDPLQAWTWSDAVYDNGTIVCEVPTLDYAKLVSENDTASLSFNVDVALNGQQFTGKPLQFRYYDIQVEKIDPAIGSSEGGTIINVRSCHK